MRPMLDDLELPQVQEILSHDRRVLAEHKPVGMDGSLVQNMGRQPTGLVLWGVAAGPGARAFVEALDEKFHAGEPLPFIADIIADAEIDQVAIDDVQWQELAGKPDRFAYLLKLVEYIEPVAPATAGGPLDDLLDSEILEDALDRMEDIVDGIQLLPEFATGLEQFVAPLQDILAGLDASQNHPNDEDG